MIHTGDRVKYISGRHGISQSNPYWDEYKVVGTVVDLDNYGDLDIYVEWDNGFENSYFPDDLEIFNPLLNKISEYYD